MQLCHNNNCGITHLITRLSTNSLQKEIPVGMGKDWEDYNLKLLGQTEDVHSPTESTLNL